MASGPSIASLTPDQDAQFRKTIEMTLSLWDALSIASNNHPDAGNAGKMLEIRANLAEAVYDEFAARASLPPDFAEDLEALLFDFCEQVFEVLVDDDSLAPTADALVRRFRLVARGVEGEGAELAELARRYQEKVARGGDRSVRATVGPEQDQETDASEDEDDDDEDGGGGGGGGGREGQGMEGVVLVDAQRLRREKPAPEVDDDGFTKVTRKR